MPQRVSDLPGFRSRALCVESLPGPSDQDIDYRRLYFVRFCFFCPRPATVLVECVPYCTTHGATALADSIDWWLNKKPREELR